MSSPATLLPLDDLRALFGESLQENVPLAHNTTARVGGPAEALLSVHSADELAEVAGQLWEKRIPFTLLGGGSNVLISDQGIRGLVVLNRSRNLRIDTHHTPPAVWAESGVNLGTLARQTALRGLSGLEWASAIPGTVGGAIYGNAGAFGGDIAHSLAEVDLLHPSLGRVTWTTDQMGYEYRSSCLKRETIPAIILDARFHLQQSTKEDVQATLEGFSQRRRATQPPGATMGSMFKNPPGDYAGRLIEAAGLKGHTVGQAEISKTHANFFVNRGAARAADIWALIQLARQTVQDRFGVQLELEIELLGDWLAGNPADIGDR